jgi:hypothetical protein
MDELTQDQDSDQGRQRHSPDQSSQVCGAADVRSMTGIQCAPSLVMQVEAEPSVGLEVEDGDPVNDAAERELEATEAFTRFPKWVHQWKVNKIKGLKCFELVRDLLLSGVPVVEVARRVQQMGEMTAIKEASVGTYLEHYKATLPAFLMAARHQPKQYLEIQERAETVIDVLQKLSKLYAQIEKRIERGLANEEKFGVVLNSVDPCFHMAAALLDRIHKVKMAMGIGPGQERQALPKSLAQQVEWDKVYARESVATVMANPDSRARVLQVAERLIDLYGKNLSLQQIEQLRRVKEVTEGDELPPSMLN